MKSLLFQNSPSRRPMLDSQRSSAWKLEDIVLSYTDNGALPPLLSPTLPRSFALEVKSSTVSNTPKVASDSLKAAPETTKRIRWINKLDDKESPKFLMRIFLSKRKPGKIVGLGIEQKGSFTTEAVKTEAAKVEITKNELTKIEPTNIEPTKNEPTKKEIAKKEPAKRETAKKELARKEPTKREPSRKEPLKKDSIHNSPLTTETVNAETANPESITNGDHQSSSSCEQGGKTKKTARQVPLSPRSLINSKSLWLNRSKATKTAAESHRKDDEFLYCIMQVDALLMRILSSLYDEHYRRESAASPSERPWMTLEQDMGRLVVEIERQATPGSPHATFMRTVLLLIFQAKAAVLYRVNNILKLIVDANLSTALTEASSGRISELNEMALDNYDRITEYCAASDPSYLLEILASTFPKTWRRRANSIADAHAHLAGFPAHFDAKSLSFYLPFGPYTCVLEVTAAIYSILSEYEGTGRRYQPLQESG